MNFSPLHHSVIQHSPPATDISDKVLKSTACLHVIFHPWQQPPKARHATRGACDVTDELDHTIEE